MKYMQDLIRPKFLTLDTIWSMVAHRILEQYCKRYKEFRRVLYAAMNSRISYTCSRLLCLRCLSIPNTYTGYLLMTLVKRRRIATLELQIILYRNINLDSFLRNKRPRSAAKM